MADRLERDLDAIWALALSNLHWKLLHAEYVSYLEGSKLLAIEENTCVIGVINEYAPWWLENEGFGGLILDKEKTPDVSSWRETIEDLLTYYAFQKFQLDTRASVKFHLLESGKTSGEHKENVDLDKQSVKGYNQDSGKSGRKNFGSPAGSGRAEILPPFDGGRNMKRSPGTASEATKHRIELASEVDRVASALPPEGHPLNLQIITFDAEHAEDGWNVVFFAGTVMNTGQKGIVLVPMRTLKILDALDIAYRTISRV